MPLRAVIVLLALLAVSLLPAGLLAQLGGSSLQSLLDQHAAQPSDWKLCNQIAIHYTQAQEFSRAAAFFRKVVTLNPGFIPARKNLGVVLWFDGKKSEAETQFRTLLDAIPNDPVPHLYIGLAFHGRNRHIEAKQHFAKAGDLALRNPEVLPTVLESYLTSGDSSLVVPALKFLEESPDSQLAVRIAAVLDRQNMPEQAYAAYAKAIASNPDDEQVYTALATFASAHKNNGFGLEVLEKGLERNPGSAQLLVHRGLLTAMEGRRDGAEKSLRAAAAADPEWSVPVFALGVLQLESGQTENAVQTFREATRKFPNEHRAHYFYALALSRTPDAGSNGTIPALQKALALEAKDVKARTLLGQSYIEVGRLKEGIVELERAVRADPTNATALYQLSLAYRKSGNTELAQQRMDAFRALKSASEEQQTELVQFLKIVK